MAWRWRGGDEAVIKENYELRENASLDTMLIMPVRYHIIDLDDLRRAGRKASDYRGPKEVVVALTRTGTLRAQQAS